MIVCDNCGLQHLDWGRDEMCPLCKNKVKEINEYDLMLSHYKAANTLIEKLKTSCGAHVRRVLEGLWEYREYNSIKEKIDDTV